MNWTHIIEGVVIGVILGVAGTWLIQERRITKLETQVDQLNKEIERINPGIGYSEPKTETSQKYSVKPEQLISIIQKQQRENVKESWGKQENQCFTSSDLDRFTQNQTPRRITESLKNDPEFLDVVAVIRTMEPGAQMKLLQAADKPLRPTWEELGRTSREGQTETGQEAERMIATAIVDLTKELIKLPEDRFKELYVY